MCEMGKLHALLVDSRRYDLGNQFQYVKATIDAALKRPELEGRVREYLRTL